MIPMPPIHWVNARHHSTPWLNTAGSGTMDEPVVVNPAVVSKKASVIPGMAPVTRYGKVPTNAMANQERATAANPSLVVISARGVMTRRARSKTPTTAMEVMAMANASDHSP